MTDGAGIPGHTGAGTGGTPPPRGGAAAALDRPRAGPPGPRGAATGWWVYRKLEGNIKEDTSAAAELRRYDRERPVHVVDGAQNVLLIGSDSRSGKENAGYGQDAGTQRSDTAILLHLPADRLSATAVSLPRDLMTTVPSCLKPDGSRTTEQLAQFNWAFEWGGAGCTVRTVETLTGIRVDHYVVVDFGGFKKVVDAVGGVEVCLKAPVDDTEARLKLPAGRQTLQGEQALGFVRARHSLGDGSDTERMDRQQEFLGSLVKKVQSNGVLLNPARLYPLLDAATSSVTTDAGLASLRGLYELVRGIRDIPTDRINFLTVPRRPYAADPNRDELAEPDAERLFRQLRMDEPVTVVPPAPVDQREQVAGTGTPEGTGAGSGSPTEGTGTTASASPVPAFTGTTAGTATCR